jgi:hypothetical protein
VARAEQHYLPGGIGRWHAGGEFALHRLGNNKAEVVDEAVVESSTTSIGVANIIYSIPRRGIMMDGGGRRGGVGRESAASQSCGFLRGSSDGGSFPRNRPWRSLFQDLAGAIASSKREESNDNSAA